MSDQKRVVPTDFGEASDAESYVRYLEKELAQSQKLEEIGMVAGVVAHDLNNILTPIFGYSTILKRDMDKDHPLAKAVGVIEKSAERAALLVSKLLSCSRQLEAVKVPFAIGKTLDVALESLNGKAVTLEKRFADVPPVLGDAHQIAMVIRAVLDNALEAIEPEGRIAIAVDVVDLDDVFCKRHPPTKPGPHVCIAISDNGHGMLPEVLERAFEPFFSTKAADFCTGIGLTLAHTIARKHLGCVTLESVHGKGATARLYLPAIKE